MSRLMLCGLASWLTLSSGVPIRADDAEDRIVLFIVKLGGKVTRDEKLPGKPVVCVDLIDPVNDNGLKELSKLKNLTTLSVRSNLVTYTGVTEISKLKNLTTLSLSVPKVTDAGLKELTKLTNLTTLSLHSYPNSPFQTSKALVPEVLVTDAGLKELAKLTNLTTLNLSVPKVTDAGLKELAKLTNLTTLNLSAPKVTDAGLKELAQLTSLTTLNLSTPKVTDAGLKELVPLKNLTSLGLKGTKVTDAGLKELVPLKNLTTITLPDTVTDETLTKLREANLLHLLPQARAEGGKRATKHEDITSLYLSSSKPSANSVTVADLLGVSEFFSNLSYPLGTSDLELFSNSKVTDAGLKEIAKLTNLTSLALSFTDVTDAGLKELAPLTKLSVLYLSNTAVTDAGLKELAKFTNLTTLNLRFTNVTADGVKELQVALPKCKIATTRIINPK